MSKTSKTYGLNDRLAKDKDGNTVVIAKVGDAKPNLVYIFPYDRIKSEKQNGLWQVWVEHQNTGDIEAFAQDKTKQKAIFKLGMDWARKNR